MKIYQLISFVNAYNKRQKKWESLRWVAKTYIGKEGLKSALFELEKEINEQKYYEGVKLSKYSEIRGKAEVHIPHIHDDGSLAYWATASKIIKSYNPQNI